MTVEGAVIREQGQSFAVVIVKRHVVDSASTSSQTIREFMPLFPGMPVVLAAQDARGLFTFYGRRDIAKFLASLHSSQIPWKRYTFS
jgi:hypothetical protein